MPMVMDVLEGRASFPEDDASSEIIEGPADRKMKKELAKIRKLEQKIG